MSTACIQSRMKWKRFSNGRDRRIAFGASVAGDDERFISSPIYVPHTYINVNILTILYCWVRRYISSLVFADICARRFEQYIAHKFRNRITASNISKCPLTRIVLVCTGKKRKQLLDQVSIRWLILSNNAYNLWKYVN